MVTIKIIIVAVTDPGPDPALTTFLRAPVVEFVAVGCATKHDMISSITRNRTSEGRNDRSKFRVILAVTTVWLTACAQTTAAPQAAVAYAAGSSAQTTTLHLKSATQVQPIAAMPSAAQTQARQLLETWQKVKSTTDPALPHDLFGEPSTVTVSSAHGNTDGTLTYYWTAASAGPTQKCGSYYFPSFLETGDAVIVYIADRYGPNANESDMCAGVGKTYSARLPLRAPLGQRVVIDVGIGTLVPVN